MSYQRLAYDDHDTAATMHSDCTACASVMSLPTRDIASAALGEAPSLEFSDYPREIRKPGINVSAAAVHLASRIHLHLD